MNDIQTWKQAITRLEQGHARLNGTDHRQLAELVAAYRDHKDVMVSLTRAAGGDALCRDCGGQCCLNGKYRLNGLDTLALMVSGAPLPIPNFAHKPLCPYGDGQGCGMEAHYRPASCIQFICEPLESLLAADAIATLAQHEHDLRELVSLSTSLMELPLGLPLLLLGEQRQHDSASGA